MKVFCKGKYSVALGKVQIKMLFIIQLTKIFIYLTKDDFFGYELVKSKKNI